jgi:hypothetical protein
LTGEAKEKALSGALAAASAFSDEGSRAQALTALAPRLTGEAKEIALSAKIQALVDHLRNLENEGRSHLLVFLATKGHFDSPVPGVTPPVLNEVASHVIDICNEWEWL